VDITVEGGIISAIAPARAAAPAPGGTAVIDAAGRYVMPGLINAHAHLHDERAGLPMPFDYQFKLWLACGITAIRDVGSDFAKAAVLRQKSRDRTIAAPKIFLYRIFRGANNAAEARAAVREIKNSGADGIKFFGLYRDVMEAMLDEARQLGLRTAHHAAIAETNAWDDIRFGTTTIEHWYGIPDAAIEKGVQDFPAAFNQTRETDRFRYAGRLWREASPARLLEVLEGMVKAKVAWVPTLNIYEAARDLERYQNQAWFRTHLHPALEKFFQPNPEYHGSFFEHWTSTDEAYWKENYRIWMDAVREFARRGGLVGIGEDAGFIYNIYGVGMIRSLEVHQEVGFPILKVIEQATVNNARILGMEASMGRVRPGYAADLLVVRGNPLEDLKILYPGRGIEWTIKDGVPYSGKRLDDEIRQMVSSARR
jgi:imidazolonepropionase-like amidohydrolase